MLEASGAVCKDSLTDYIFEECTLLSLGLRLHVIEKVFARETRTTDDHAANSSISLLSVGRKVMSQSIDYVVVELCLRRLILLGGHCATRFCNRLLDFLLQQSLMLTNDEYVSHAFFHSNGNYIASVLLLDHLIQFSHMH